MRFSSLALALSLALTSTAQARWQVKSEFQLHLTEPTFDKLIQDFWQSLQGTQRIPVGNIPVNLGDIQLSINGVNVNVDYSFAVPQRVDPNHREWELKSQKISGRVTVDELNAIIRKVTVINGITFVSTTPISCQNISLVLPEGNAAISARLRAEVAQNQVRLTMPSYSATWPSGAWRIESLNCPDLANISGQVQEQIVNFLSTFENMDATVHSALDRQFVKWSNDASLLLLSQQELPSKSDFLKIYYEPKTAVENGGNGLILGGTLRFDYPYVAQGQNFEQSFDLPSGENLVPSADPQLIIPFASVRALMMGQYFAGKLEYTMRSPELPAFQSLMQSRWKQFFGWPDLMNFEKNTTFLFQFMPLGPPSFDNEASGTGNSITGDLNLPVSVRMYAPLEGIYTPYVEFRTLLSGPASMQLGSDGKVNVKIEASEQPTSYAYAQRYVQLRDPNTHIAISTIASAARDALNTDGLALALPTFTVGKQLSLVPNAWNMQKNKVLKLNFAVNSAATAPVVSSTVKTANGKTLTVTSSKKKKP